jgi:hypothetical protein
MALYGERGGAVRPALQIAMPPFATHLCPVGDNLQGVLNSGDIILYSWKSAAGKHPCANELDFLDILFIPGILGKCGDWYVLLTFKLSNPCTRGFVFKPF